MSCHPTPPGKTHLQLLNEAATAFALLGLTVSKQTITDMYLEYRQALFDAMIADIDASRFYISWNTIKSFGDTEIATLQQLPDRSEQYSQALAHLQLLIKQSHAFVPWG